MNPAIHPSAVLRDRDHDRRPGVAVTGAIRVGCSGWSYREWRGPSLWIGTAPQGFQEAMPCPVGQSRSTDPRIRRPEPPTNAQAEV